MSSYGDGVSEEIGSGVVVVGEGDVMIDDPIGVGVVVID